MATVIFDHFQAFSPPLKADYADLTSWKRAVMRWLSIPREVREAIAGNPGIDVIADRFLFDDLNDINAIPAEPFFEEKIREAELSGVVTAKDLTTVWLACLGQIRKFDRPSSRNVVMSEVNSDTFSYRDAREYFDDFVGRIFYLCEIEDNRLCWFNFFSIYAKQYGSIEIGLRLFSRERPDVGGIYSRFLSIVSDLQGDNRDPAELWEKAQSDEDVKDAICCAMKRVWTEIANSPPPKLFVARGFHATLRRVQGTNSGQFSSVCRHKALQAATVNPVLEVSDLRVSKKPTSKPRQYGKFVARRAHVTKENEGLRLMFWQSEDEIVLDSVRTKWDVKISDPVEYI